LRTGRRRVAFACFSNCGRLDEDSIREKSRRTPARPGETPGAIPAKPRAAPAWSATHWLAAAVPRGPSFAPGGACTEPQTFRARQIAPWAPLRAAAPGVRSSSTAHAGPTKRNAGLAWCRRPVGVATARRAACFAAAHALLLPLLLHAPEGWSARLRTADARRARSGGVRDSGRLAACRRRRRKRPVHPACGATARASAVPSRAIRHDTWHPCNENPSNAFWRTVRAAPNRQPLLR